MLANVTSDADGLSEGTAVRRTSSATLLDTVPYVSYETCQRQVSGSVLREKEVLFWQITVIECLYSLRHSIFPG